VRRLARRSISNTPCVCGTLKWLIGIGIRTFGHHHHSRVRSFHPGKPCQQIDDPSLSLSLSTFHMDLQNWMFGVVLIILRDNHVLALPCLKKKLKKVLLSQIEP